MIKTSFEIKNKKYSLNIERGQDALKALDNFLKSNKLEGTYFKKVKVDCLGQEDSVSCRIVKLVLSVLRNVESE